MVLSLLFVVLAQGSAFPLECPALGRPLAWDPHGLYALDAEGPLTAAGRSIVQALRDAELGRAEALARGRLRLDREDLVPAWALAQIVRVRRGTVAEYRERIHPEAGKDAPVPVLLYRFHVCRLAAIELRKEPEGERARRDMQTVRDQLRPFAAKRLGITLALTQARVDWAEFSRETLQAYAKAHPAGSDVRRLLCRAYVEGILYCDSETGKPDRSPHWKNVPVPEQGLALAQTLLKERPFDPFGLYYAGRAHFMLGKVDEAVRDLRKALDTGGLPPTFEGCARDFVRRPSERAFHPSPSPVD